MIVHLFNLFHQFNHQKKNNNQRLKSNLNALVKSLPEEIHSHL